MQDSYICVGGPLQGRSFTAPPAGYHRCSVERGFKQGQYYVWEYDGTDCLDELLAAAVRYGKFRDPHMTALQAAERTNHIEQAYVDPNDLDRAIDNEPFGRLPE